ncbi:MAG: AraC family transcriptional regulator [Clostridium sp.]
MINTIEYLVDSPLYVSSSLTLYQCGWENCCPSHDFGPAIRPHYLFHYILSGKGKFYAHGQWHDLTEKQGFLICPGDSTYYIADEKDPWDYCWFGFDGYETKNILTHCNISKENPIFTDNSQGMLKQELLKLIEIFESHHFNEYEAMGQLYLVFSKMQQSKKEHLKTYDKGYSDKAVDFIQHNYSYDIKIADIAKHIGIDRTYLYKIFIQLHNISPQQYLIQFRLHVACKLLESSNINITEISYSSGFKDTPAFYKHFKRHYGITPSKYRSSFISSDSYIQIISPPNNSTSTYR